MITKLPNWVWVGAWMLAFVAGIINVVGLMGFTHETITHLTGNTSRLAEAIANMDLSGMGHFSFLIGSFVLGTVLSGFFIQDSTLKLGRRYGVVLFLESLLLFVSVPLLKSHRLYGIYLTACASGLQNAMVSTYSGAVVRTTHISGMFTDLGISLGHAMRGIPIHSKRLLLCLVVISGFLVGGVFGASTFKLYGYSALLFPATFTAIVSIVYSIYRTHASHS